MKILNILKKHIWIIITTIVLLLILAGILISNCLKYIPLQKETRIYIPHNATYNDVVDTLTVHACINDATSFNSIANIRKYPKHVKPGSYLIKPGMTQLDLIHKLRSGNQDPIRITINKHRTTEQLCLFLADKLELDYDTIHKALTDDSICAVYGYTPTTIICMFPRNTYEIYWDITIEKLLKRFHKETERFWTPLRKASAEQMGLSQSEVVTLASIIDEETNKNDEKSNIASVYLNRMEKGMPLQADPTVKFAIGDFGLKRILNKHLEVDSPYNTYKYNGLPPGPICIPSVSSIDAVLQNPQTTYLYFCAKEDFSGYHNFASSLSEHNRNASRYHEALNRKRIR